MSKATNSFAEQALMPSASKDDDPPARPSGEARWFTLAEVMEVLKVNRSTLKQLLYYHKAALNEPTYFIKKGTDVRYRAINNTDLQRLISFREPAVRKETFIFTRYQTDACPKGN